MLLKLGGWKKSQIQDFPLGLWFSQIDSSELTKGVAFVLGVGLVQIKVLKALSVAVVGW